MGVDVNIEFMPHKRALEAARLAKTDGTFIRSELIAQACPELIKVPVPLVASRVSVFATDPSLLDKLGGWESLVPYRVAYISGWLWIDRYLPACKEVHQIKKKNSLLLFLTKDRADVAIYEEGLGYEEMRKLGLEGIYVLETPLSVAQMYLYMSSQHSDMIPEIVTTLREMEADGTLQALRVKHHQQYRHASASGPDANRPQ